MRRHHEASHAPKNTSYPAICVDIETGIFVVANKEGGLLAPIHVQSHCGIGKLVCTSDICEFVLPQNLRKNPSLECKHPEACKQMINPKRIDLQDDFLYKLKEINVINENTVQKCFKIRDIAKTEAQPLVVFVDFMSLGYEGRHKYFSVFLESQEFISYRNCRLGRVRVTFDMDTGDWSCVCPLANQHACIHKTLAKWYLMQCDESSLSAISRLLKYNLLHRP